jgi:hypothetical protein
MMNGDNDPVLSVKFEFCDEVGGSRLGRVLVDIANDSIKLDAREGDVNG